MALEGPPSAGSQPWVWVGLAWGGAMLSKYHAGLIPLGIVLYRLAASSACGDGFFNRGRISRCCWVWPLFSPVLLWNADHRWASFLFQGGRAVGSWTLRPDYLAVALLAQVAYLFPWIWLPLVIILVGGIRGWSERSGNQLVPQRLLLCLAVVPLGLFHGRRLLPAGVTALGFDRSGLVVSAPGKPVVGCVSRKIRGGRVACLRPGPSGLACGTSGCDSANSIRVGFSEVTAVGWESSISAPTPRSTSTAGTRSPAG